MTTHRALLALSVGGAAALAACAPSVRSQRDESIPVPRGASWAWATAPAPARYGPSDSAVPERGRGWTRGGRFYGRDRGPYGRPPFDDAQFAQQFRRAVEARMQQRGFSRVEDTSAAEFALSFELGPDTRLAMQLTQRARGEVAWRASYIMDIYDLRDSSPDGVQRIADRMVRELR